MGGKGGILSVEAILPLPRLLEAQGQKGPWMNNGWRTYLVQAYKGGQGVLEGGHVSAWAQSTDTGTCCPYVLAGMHPSSWGMYCLLTKCSAALQASFLSTTGPERNCYWMQVSFWGDVS